jgi:hypothetical protein
VRELVKGDYALEVEGNYTQNIHGEHEVKIGKNRAEQILGNYASNINESVKARVGGYYDKLINKDETRSVGGLFDLAVFKRISIGSLTSDVLAFAEKDFQITATSGVVSFKAGDKLDMKSAKAMTIKTEADGLNITSTGAVTETFSSTLTTTVTAAVSETFSAGQTTNITGTLNLDASTEVDIDAPTINLN